MSSEDSENIGIDREVSVSIASLDEEDFAVVKTEVRIPLRPQGSAGHTMIRSSDERDGSGGDEPDGNDDDTPDKDQ